MELCCFSLPRLLELTWFIVPVQDTESQEGTIAMGCERGLGQGCQVVHVVERRPLVLIVASQEEVDMIRGLQQKVMAKGSSQQYHLHRFLWPMATFHLSVNEIIAATK